MSKSNIKITKVRLKGVNVPRFVTKMKGRKHARKGYIIRSIDGNWSSEYVQQRFKDYHEYSAQIYNNAVKDLEDAKCKIVELEHIVDFICEQIAELTPLVDVSEDKMQELTALQQRRLKADSGRLKEFKERRQHIERERGILLADVDSYYALMQEQLIAAKRKVESRLTAYFLGASKYIDENPKVEIPVDLKSWNVFNGSINSLYVDDERNEIICLGAADEIENR